MLDKSPARLIVRTAAAGCAALVLTFGASSAQAQDDELSFEQKIIDSLLGRNSGPGIDYRERSPLVIPPSTELPPPEGRTAAAATPNWPNDPDEARRRTESNKAPVIDVFRRNDAPLSPEELRRGRVRASRSTELVRTPSDSEMSRALRPSELGAKTLLGGLFSGSSSDKPEQFTGEGRRTSLIEPPSGYRTPAPTQPYAPPKESGVWYKPFSWFDWGTERN